MRKSAIKLFLFFTVLSLIISMGCAGAMRGKLNKVQQPTEDELRRNWKEYTVFYRSNDAILYKVKDARKIVLDDSWVPVSSEDMMARSKILANTQVREILGQNDDLYGYLVQSYRKTPYVGIVDNNTVKLSYPPARSPASGSTGP